MTKSEQVEINKMDKPFPFWFMALIPFYISGIFIAIFFPVSNDWRWIEAWIIVGTFTLNMTLNYFLINYKNPRVLRNRIRMRKKGITEGTKNSAGSDIIILPLIFVFFTGVFILPAIDHRYGWSPIPLAGTIVGLAVANIGLIIMNVAILQNAYASKILDINEQQKLKDTGLYGKVRHPLYTGATVLALGLPIALGSWIALSSAVCFILVIVIRIKFEEAMLIEGMDGYKEYKKRVRYRLIPGIY